MRLLVVTPDYASHYFPLSAVAAAWQEAGGHATVACGPGLAERVRADGFDQVELILGPGSNPGLLRTDEQPGSEGGHLERFFAATRDGMVATLSYQAEARRHDLLWRPRQVAEDLRRILAEVRPSAVLSDQIAFGASAALRALGVPYASFVTGHPVSVPGPGELYGFPHLHPPGFAVATREPGGSADPAESADPAKSAELGELRRLCQRVGEEFTAEFNDAVASISPGVAPVADALGVSSPWLTLFNYPGRLVGERRPLLPASARFLGSSVRREGLDSELDGWLADRAAGVATVYASFGSFLSAREDALGRLVEALRDRPWRVVLASGVADPASLGTLPPEWMVRPYLPQVAVLEHCDLVITHGGNNTVTEALTAGLPMVVAPFSTDQFAGAESLRRAGLAEVIDPNRSSPDRIAAAVKGVLEGEHVRRAARLGVELRTDPGPQRAVRYCRDLLP